MNALRFFVSASTVLVASLAAAQPVNDTCATALPIPTPSGFQRARSTPSGLADSGVLPEVLLSCAPNATSTVWYSFVPAESGLFEFQSCGPLLPFASAVDTALAVYGGACGSLTEVAGGCDDDWCGTGSGGRVVVNLVAGNTYYLQTGRANALAALTDSVQFSVAKVSGADSCVGPVPDLPVAMSVPLAITSRLANDSQVSGGLACYAGTGHLALNATTATASGRDLVHRFTAAKDARYSFRLSSSLHAMDSALYLTDSCVSPTQPPQLYAPPQCIAAANRHAGSANTTQEEVTCVPMTTGQVVYVWVDEGTLETGAALGSSHGLEVTECEREVEPNNTPAEASPMPSCGLTGSIPDGGDVDFYALGTPAAAGTRVFAMAEAGASGVNQVTSFDLQLRVTTSTTTVEYDNNDLVDPYGSTAPGVAGTPLAAGTPQFLRVNHTSTTSVVEPYRLYTVLQSGTALAETEPNDTAVQANVGASNYFSGSLPTVGDVDFYAFQAPQGAVVYLALDSQPARTGTTSTGEHNLALYDSQGQLFLAADSNSVVNNTASTSLTSTTPSSPSEHILYRAPAPGTYFARVGRTGSGTNNNYLLSIALDCSPGGGFAAPTLTAVSPSTGSTLGGELLTLTGTDLGAGTVVRIGGVVAPFVSGGGSSLVVRTPFGADGTVDVSVTNFGFAAVTLPGAYTYATPAGPPTVTSVLPGAGPSSGGTVLTVRGTLFKPGAEVRFEVGGNVVAGTDVTVVSLLELRVTTPAQTPGLATLTVRNPTDGLEGSLPNAFRFNPPPTLSAVSPATALVAGGTTMTLTGTGFSPGATVRFGTNAATNVVVDGSGTSLTATLPASTLGGPVDVVVVNSDSQLARATNLFAYVFPAPTLTAITPARGPSSGGTLLTLTGTNFLAGIAVLVNGELATSIVRVSATQVTALAPAGAAGTYDVMVVNPDLQSATLTNGFTWVAPPTVTAVSPNRGPVIGGTPVTVTGTAFQPGLVLRIGGGPAFAVMMTSATTATGIAPAGAAGLADVTVVNPDGQASTLDDAFTYDGAPAVATVSPPVGSTSGGTRVTVRGVGFLTGAQVRFGSELGTNVTLVSPTELQVSTPAASMSVVSVTVQNPDGQSGSLTGAFRYVRGVSATSVSPTTGDVTGGTVTRIVGAGFETGMTVSFGGVASPLVTLVDDTTVEALTPPHEAGAVDVEVASSGTQATLVGAFTYTRGAPSILAVAPASGPVEGGTLLVVSGTGFTADATVSVGGNAATNVVVVSAGLLRARTAAHAAGQVDVVVTNGDQQAATASNAFTYVADPDGTTGVVGDGGMGGLGAAPDAGATTMQPPSGCGCSQLEGSLMAFAMLGLLARRRGRRS